MHRNHSIDLLRGMCIISVVLLHCRIHIPLHTQILPPWLFNLVFNSGYYGVIIFFVISGFLIMNHCLLRWGNYHTIQTRDFYRMRLARIMPCLLLLLLISSLVNLIHLNGFIIHTTTLPHALFAALTFHINYLEAKTGYLPANWDVLWSLSVEEIFYIFFPLLCLLCKKSWQFILLLSLFIVIAPFARTTLSHNSMWLDHSYLSCMDGIAMGCLAALLSYHIKINAAILKLLFVIGICVFSLIFFFRHFSYETGLTFMNLNVTFLEFSVACLLIVMNERPIKQNFKVLFWLTPIRSLGQNSYEIYLTHSFIILLCARIVFHTDQIIFAEYLMILVVCGLLGQGISTYFSEPMRKWIRDQNKSQRMIVRSTDMPN